MLIDSNLIFFENTPITNAAVTSAVVPITSMIAGRAEPLRVFSAVTETFAGGTAIDFKLEESADGESGWTAVPQTALSVETAALVKDAPILPRFLGGVSKPYLRLTATPAAESVFTAGKITVAITREDPEPYAEGLHKGV